MSLLVFVVSSLFCWILVHAGSPTATIGVDIDCADCICVFRYTGDLRSSAPVTIRSSPSCVGEYDRINAGIFMSNLTAWTTHNTSLAVASPAPGVFVVEQAGDLARVEYHVDIRSEQAKLGDVLASCHCDANKTHTLLSGYAAFAWIQGHENSSYLGQVRAPQHWIVFGTLPNTQNTHLFAAPSLFSLLDSPFLLGEKSLVTTAQVSVPAGFDNTTMAVWSAAPLQDTLLQKLLVVASHAAAAMSLLHAAPMTHQQYTILVELFDPSFPSLGWALEHEASFQAMDSAESFLNFTELRLAYHFTHHMYHSYFVPRRIYTDLLQPTRCWQYCVSEFIWFAEGFAQYNAFAGLAATGHYTVEDILFALAQRFGEPYLTTPFPNATLLTVSREIALGNNTLWFFMYSAGALLGMMIDQQMRVENCSYGLHESMLGLQEWINAHGGAGVPEAEFERVFAEAAGFSIAPIFAAYVRAVTILPVEDIFSAAGISITQSPQGLTFTVIPTAQCDQQVQRFRRCAFGPGV